MPAPFLPLVLCMAAGLLIGRTAGAGALLWSGLLAATLASGWLCFGLKRQVLVFCCLLLSAFSLGGLRSHCVHSSYDRHPLLPLRLEGYADFEGRLEHSPSRGRGESRLALRLEGIRYGKQRLRLQGRIRVTILHGAPSDARLLRRYRPGDRIRVSARLVERAGFRNFDESSVAHVLEQQGFHRSAFSKSPLLVVLLAEGSPFDPRRWAAMLRNRLLDQIEEAFQAPGGGLTSSGAFVEAVLLGERGHLDEDLAESLRESGLFHVIAISGAHIAVFIFLLRWLLALFRFPRRASTVFLILVLAFYALMVEGRASVLRAVLMASLYLLGKILWTDIRPMHTVSLSAFILLLLNPLSLWEAGFELTFAATLSLILFAPRILKLLPRLPLGLPHLIAASFAAHLGVTPILASLFNRVALAGLILNLAALPLMAAVMAAGYSFLVLVHIHPLAGHAAAAVVDFLVRIFLFLSRLPGQVPFLSYRIPSPPTLVLMCYVSLLLAFLLPSARRRQTAVLRLLFLWAYAALVIYPFPARYSPGLRLTFLDVGQGDATLVEFPGRKKMLVDGGGLSGSDFDMGESVVSPFLWRAKMKRVEILASTHAHPDHIEGLAAVARNFKVGEVWEAAAPPLDAQENRFRRSLSSSVSVRRVAERDVFIISGVLIEILHPPPVESGREVVDNDASLVLRLTYGRISVLLTSDIGQASEERLIRRQPALEACVLKAAHHGSSTSTTSEFLALVKPRLAVISCGRGNVYGMPSPIVLERLRQAGVRTYRTDLNGAVEVSSDGRSVKVRTAVPGTTF